MAKILIVSNMYPSKKYPHYGVFVKNSLHLLKKSGHTVEKDVLYKRDNFIIKLINYGAFTLKSIPRAIFGKYDYIYVHYVSHCAFYVLLFHFFSKKTKIVLNFHGNDLVPETESDYKYQALVKKCISICNRFVVPSIYFSDYLKDNFNLEGRKVDIISSGGVNNEQFVYVDKNIAQQEIGFIQKSKYVIGYVSRVEENKGWDDFLNAAHILLRDGYDVEFLIVGSGSQSEEYEKLKIKLNLSEHITKWDFMDQEKLKFVYNSVDIFCFPTKRVSESLGLVGLEAMSCETITVTGNKFGPSTYINDGVNGFTFDTGNFESLATVMKKATLLSDNEIQVIKQNARSTSLKYSSTSNEEEYNELFKRSI